MLPCPLPGDLPNPGIEPGSPELQAYSLLSEPPGKPNFIYSSVHMSLQISQFIPPLKWHLIGSLISLITSACSCLLPIFLLDYFSLLKVLCISWTHIIYSSYVLKMYSLSLWTSQVAQMVKNLPAEQETQVGFLDWEDPLEKEIATHSSILAWEISWTEVPGKLQPLGSQRVGHDSLSFTF